MRKILVIAFAFLASCASLRKPEPFAKMHGFLLSPSLRNSASVQPLLKDADDNHKIDWTKFNGTPTKPLTGMRIALDPGHMGGSPWDERGGKYLLNSHNQKLSEGTMALQLALLLETEFKKLGATVMIDRRELTPVTARDFGDFDGIHSTAFFQRIDLDARAEKLWAFRPDLTLILHFDSHIDDQPPNPDKVKVLCNETKAYVPGEFSEKDFYDDVDRALFQIIWRNPSVWNDSVALSREITEQINQQMKIPLAVKSDFHAALIEPGVLARNLRLQRRMAGFVTTYLESLCYEDLAEFQALSQGDFSVKISGVSTPYSQRLVRLAHAIRDGVLHFRQTQLPTQL